MARAAAKPAPEFERQLRPVCRNCPACGRRMWASYEGPAHRPHAREGVARIPLQVRRCVHAACSRYHVPYRPEREGGWALPQHEFGLDVIALVGTLRYREHRSVPEIHRRLRERGLSISERSKTNLVHRYDELMALSAMDEDRLRRITAEQGRVILALDGLQPDTGYEVLWVLRDCLWDQVLLTASLLSARQRDLAELVGSVRGVLDVRIVGVISDGQSSIRKALAGGVAGPAAPAVPVPTDPAGFARIDHLSHSNPNNGQNS